MFDVLETHEPVLTNTIGHAAGVLLFGLLLGLFLRDRRGASLRRGLLPIAAAFLALLWNLGSLAVLAANGAFRVPADGIATLSFAVLSLLPAVLLHLSLEGRLPWLWRAGYVLSLSAALLHAADLTHVYPPLHHVALLMISYGFAGLTLASLAASRQGASRGFGAMCLFLLAISFVHFAPGRASRAWSGEIAWHHAGIPLALFVLLQDYRFLLLDAFVRFLANAGVAAVFALAIVEGNNRLRLLEQISGNPFLSGIAIVVFCLVLILFADVRRIVQKWLTRVVFHREDLPTTLSALRTMGASMRDEVVFLDAAATQVAAFMRAERATWREGSADALPPGPMPLPERSLLRHEADWADAVVPLRLTLGDSRYLLVGARLGGRRYLSEDLRELSVLAATIVEQIERFRAAAMQQLVSQAELRALQAQINPHFLFNALNTLYGTIPREAAGARRLVLNLSDIFRYFLQPEKTLIPLTEELRIVQAYLEIEALRLGARLQTEILIDEAARGTLIPVLSIQPLVENAVKHGVSVMPEAGTVRLIVEALKEGVRIRVEDTGAGFAQKSAQPGAGIGLDNVRQRLKLCYGPRADLDIQSSSRGSAVGFLIPYVVT